MKRKAFKHWRKEKIKPLLIKGLIILFIVAVQFFLFVLFMCYLIACGVQAGYEIRI